MGSCTDPWPCAWGRSCTPPTDLNALLSGALCSSGTQARVLICVPWGVPPRVLPTVSRTLFSSNLDVEAVCLPTQTHSFPHFPYGVVCTDFNTPSTEGSDLLEVSSLLWQERPLQSVPPCLFGIASSPYNGNRDRSCGYVELLAASKRHFAKAPLHVSPSLRSPLHSPRD